MAAYSPYSVMERLNAAQGKTLLYRCKLMEEILCTTSIKELKSAFPYILHEIFDFEKSQSQGWQLDRIYRSHNQELFERARHLLAPEGPLMKVVNSLHGDPHALYEFPLKYIPAPARQMIEDGAVPAFYANKLQGHSYSMAVLMLNAFELFVFHLAYALVSPVWQSRNQGWSDLYEFVYPIVIDDLLVYFLPCDKSSLPSIPHFNGPVVRPTMVSGSPGRYGMSPGQLSPTNGMSNSSHRSLFKPSFINAQKQHQQSMPVFDQAETEIWRSETFLQVITEFWLNQNTFNGSEMNTFGRGLQFSAAYNKDPLISMFEHFMPTMNHVKMVRLLVKYLHHFANSATSVITSPYHQTVQSPLDQFKRSVIPHILQKKLYTFLRHAFDRWPLDSCFRMVLETWLSFIQPWRYQDFSKRTAIEAQQSDTELKTSRVDDKWDHFVEENLLFYTVLTGEFLPRIYRMDLTSPYSAYMVYRVSRILDLHNLSNLILKAEQELFGSLIQQTDLGGSYLSSHSMHLVYAPPTQMLELEGPNFQYVPLFSEPMKYNIMKVVAQLSDALESVRIQQNISASSGKSEKQQGFFASLFSRGASFGGLNNYSSPEYKRLPLHLEHAIINFCSIFQIPTPACVIEPESKQTLNMSIANESMYLAESENQRPDCIETPEGLKLTDIGRRQLINRERKFDKFYVGDPDLQPVRSNENAMLVRLLFQFCSFINSYFCAEFNSLYFKQNFLGHFARVFLIPPSSLETLQKKLRSPISERASQLTRSRQPRISLRFLASYQTIVNTVIAYLVLSLLLGGFVSFMGFIFFLASLVFLYGLAVASVRWVRGQTVQ